MSPAWSVALQAAPHDERPVARDHAVALAGLLDRDLELLLDELGGDGLHAGDRHGARPLPEQPPLQPSKVELVSGDGRERHLRAGRIGLRARGLVGRAGRAARARSRPSRPRRRTQRRSTMADELPTRTVHAIVAVFETLPLLEVDEHPNLLGLALLLGELVAEGRRADEADRPDLRLRLRAGERGRDDRHRALRSLDAQQPGAALLQRQRCRTSPSRRAAPASSRPDAPWPPRRLPVRTPRS